MPGDDHSLADIVCHKVIQRIKNETKLPDCQITVFPSGYVIIGWSQYNALWFIHKDIKDMTLMDYNNVFRARIFVSPNPVSDYPNYVFTQMMSHLMTGCA